MSSTNEERLIVMMRRQEICMVIFGAVMFVFAWVLIQDRQSSREGIQLDNSNSNVSGAGLGESEFRDYYTREEFSEVTGLSISTIQRKQKAGLIQPEPWMTSRGAWAYPKNAQVIDDRAVSGQ